MRGMGESVQVRVGDRERRAVDDVLMAAVADGVLTLAEYDERATALWQAKVRAELDVLMADLPGTQLPAVEPARAPAPAPDGPPSTRWVVAVMSEDELRTPLAPGQGVVGLALMGKAVVDLDQPGLPDGVRVRAHSLMGEVEVVVPPGSTVHLSGLSLMGERKVRVTGGGGGPVVHVSSVAVMGSVHVREGRSEPAPGWTSSGVVAPRPAAPALRSGSEPVRRSRASRLASRLGGGALSLVLLAGVGGVVASGTEARAVFGSTVKQVGASDEPIEVSVMFGSVTVVVPDEVVVNPGGLVVFGSVDCDAACQPQQGARVVDLRALGAFGSVEVLTSEEHQEELAEDDDR
jgi:hypothetical protein